MNTSVEEYGLTATWCLEGRTFLEGLPTSRLSFETFQVEGSVLTNV